MRHEEESLPQLDLENILRRQLATFAMANEISRVVASAMHLDAVVQALGNGFCELMGFRRVIVFSVDTRLPGLRPLGGSGLDPEIAQLRFGLDFLSGEYTDAIFRNRHVIVESVPEFDAFYSIKSRQYAAFPLVGRITSHCRETRHCHCTECPCFDAPNPYCWATEGAAQFTGTHSEDDRRQACVRCPQFKCLGLLWLDLTDRAMLTGDDVTVISAIALQTGLVLENFAMYDTLRANNRQLQETNDALEKAQKVIHRDLEQARKIQKRLLPSHFPPGLSDMAWHYEAQIEIGGDYFDCFTIRPGLFGLVIADVSGHGVSAALVMSMFKVLLKEIAPRAESPAQVLMTINETFIRELRSDQFVTVFYGIWNAQERILRWTNAGHPPALLQSLQSGEISPLPSCGPFVGMLDNLQLRDFESRLSEPHRLLLYTDGIIEAENPHKEPFGGDRLQTILSQTQSLDCQSTIDRILSALRQHLLQNAHHDDITLLIGNL